MKAIIMAGGEGTRLKPVSGDTPKPLISLCGRPVMEHIVGLLKKHGITDICCTLKYRPEEIMGYFGDGERFGVSMQYRIEGSTLGTAGGVKNCGDFYGDEDFLVISGDAICDFDLTDFIAEHFKHGKVVSMALYPHPEPLRYGLALCDGEYCVKSFIEKPDWKRVVTNLVNTGIYIISPRAMESVPEGREFDFGKDLFPLLVDSGEKLFGYVAQGYWCDIGTPKSYYECCVDALSGKLDIELCGGFEAAVQDSAVEDYDGECVSCRDRARLMDSVSAVFMDMGAYFSEGLKLHGSDFELSVFPLSSSAALCIRANSADTELASELSAATASLVREIENRLE